MKKRSILFAAVCLMLLPVMAQGTWDKDKWPTAERYDANQARDFQWKPGPSNQPIGEARGIYPGRVVMARYPEAAQWPGRWNVNEDQWFLDKYTSTDKCDEMVATTVQRLTGTKSNRKAWKRVFRFHNKEIRGMRCRGYRKGEVVAVKINLNNSSAGKRDNQTDATPQMTLAVVRHLVRDAKVPEKDIIIYDVKRQIYPQFLESIWREFPDVRFVQDGEARSEQPVNPKYGDHHGIEAAQWVEGIEFSVDNDKFREAKQMAQQILDATYIVNLALLKLHSYPYNYMEDGDNGQTAITMSAKNHAGSIRGTFEMHSYFNSTQIKQRGLEHGYNPLVDLEASPNLGQKTILYLLDALYCGRKWRSYPLHFPGAPFYNRTEPYENPDWPASLLASFDPVAIQSVGLDIMYAQSLNNTEPGYYDVPRILLRDMADDILKEMATPSSTPSGTVYKQQGKPILSLGVFEHWDSPYTMRYSRNLDSKNGKGIEFIYIPMGSAEPQPRPTLAGLLPLFTDEKVPADGPFEDLNVGNGGRYDHPVEAAELPGGGLSRYPMIYIGEGYNRISIINDGKIVWKYDTGPGWELDDIWMLKNGDLLFTRMGWAAKVSPDKKELWRYDCKEGEEIHTLQPIGDDEAIMLINAFPARVWRFNHKTGETIWEKEIDFNVNSTHIQSRRMRYTKDGTFLICYLGENKVVEYDEDWNEVHTFNVSKPWAAIRLKNGNTLITLESERRTIEVDKNDNVVWEISLDELPEPYRLPDCQSVCRLQNGNTILCSRGSGHGNQLVEVTPDKRVVWVLNDWEHLGPATSVQILSEEGYSENPGDLER